MFETNNYCQSHIVTKLNQIKFSNLSCKEKACKLILQAFYCC